MKSFVHFIWLSLLGGVPVIQAAERPNIVMIYADDLGFGDLSCYNPDSKIQTPYIDRLAADGIQFMDAHAPDTLCAPSRYGLLNGRYSWRTERKRGNPRVGEEPWLNEGRLTLPGMLKNIGYDTAVVGKWGLGTDWSLAEKPNRKGLDISTDAIDYSKPAYSGRPYGFTYEDVHLWYGGNYFKKHYPCDPDLTDGGRWYFENGMSRNGDPEFAAFDMEEAQMHYIHRSVQYIDAKGGRMEYPAFNQTDGAPFFLYYAPHIPHWPHVPAPQFQGTTGIPYYGDFIAELDWAVGQIVDALERNDMLENTLIIFASDNGPEKQAYGYIKDYDHYSMGPYRGLKRDAWEGGQRTPMIISWAGRIDGGKKSSRLVSQTDIFATIADYLKVSLPEDCAEDSVSFLDELLPDSLKPEKPRSFAVHHTGFTHVLALRKGDWVLVDGPTAGHHKQEPQWMREALGVKPHSAPVELFNLKKDPKQTENMAAQYPERVQEMQMLLQEIVRSGESVRIAERLSRE